MIETFTTFTTFTNLYNFHSVKTISEVQNHMRCNIDIVITCAVTLMVSVTLIFPGELLIDHLQFFKNLSHMYFSIKTL